jgi:acyl-CoA reductase-like NAD-dependent aldehyde dehydrogenase
MGAALARAARWNRIHGYTEVGPLVHKTHFDKVLSYVDAAREAGATIAVGGNIRSDLGAGNYFSPTLFRMPITR